MSISGHDHVELNRLTDTYLQCFVSQTETLRIGQVAHLSPFCEGLGSVKFMLQGLKKSLNGESIFREYSILLTCPRSPKGANRSDFRATIHSQSVNDALLVFATFKSAIRGPASR